MVKTLINNHLSILLNAKAKGITLDRFSEIQPSLRNEIQKVNRILDVRGRTWNRIIGSSALANFVNNSKIEASLLDSILDDVVSSETKLKEVEKAITFEKIEELYVKVEEIHKKREEGVSYYSNRYNLSDLLPDVILYFLEYGYDSEQVEQVYDVIRDLKRSYLKQDSMGKEEERIHFIHLKTLEYPSYIDDNVLVHFREARNDFAFYEKLFVYLGNSQFERTYKPIAKLLKRVNDREQVKQDLLTLLGEYEVLGVRWLHELVPTSADYVTEHELKRLLKNAPAATLEDDVYSIIYGRDTLYQQVLASCKEGSYSALRRLIKQAIVNKKKAFLRLITDHIDQFKGFTSSNVLFQSKFQKLLNLNTLNGKNVKDLAEMHNSKNLDTLSEDVPLTFQELHFLYNKDELVRAVFYNLLDMPVDDRLRICRQLPNLKAVQNMLFDNAEELINRVTQLVRIKPLKTWIEERKLKLTQADDEHYMVVLLAPEKFERFTSEISRGKDVEFILQHHELMEYANSLDEAKMMFILEDEETQYMLNKIGVSKEFITQNKSHIISFSERKLTEVFKRMHERDNLSSEQQRNLNLIAKAELSGKLNEIKFVDEDFELEIGLPINDKSKLEWKQNRDKKVGRFTVEEACDFETTIRLGQNPVSTCMNWNSGSYSHCLLSNFDTNKKLMVARDSKGNVVSRAILRLTKGSETYISQKDKSTIKKLAFKDVEEGVQKEEKETAPQKEDLVLFLERCYTSLDSSQSKTIDREFVKLAREKAKALGAKLVVSTDYYGDAVEGLRQRDYYIFISYSKNGSQYLDSLTGQATESNAGDYRVAEVLMEKE